MNPKDRLLKELENLSNSSILKVYDLVLTLKEKEKTKRVTSSKDYLRAREALKNCKGSLSDDIKEERKERV